MRGCGRVQGSTCSGRGRGAGAGVTVGRHVIVFIFFLFLSSCPPPTTPVLLSLPVCAQAASALLPSLLFLFLVILLRASPLCIQMMTL